MKPGFSDLFGKAGMRWLEGLRLSPVDQLILETDLRLLRSLNEQVYAVTRAVASLALSEAPVRLVMTMPGIDYYSAMLILAELRGDIHRFPSASKPSSWAGLVLSLYQSRGESLHGQNREGSPMWLRWVLVQAAQKASLSDRRLGGLYTRVAARRGHQKAVVAVAREMLTIMWHMLWRREPYRGVDRRLTERKLKRMEGTASR
ncbi:MAG: transposase [Candidatus Bathyarchaeia archaeon]